MIFLALPALARLPFEEAARIVSSSFRNWEILGEGTLSLESIKDSFDDVILSYGIENVQLHAPFSDINIGSYREDVRHFSVNFLKRNIETAAGLGMRHVTIHPGVLSPYTFGQRDYVIRQTNRSLRELNPAVMDLGIPVSLENMPAMPITVGHTPEEMLRMTEGTEIGICLDIGHASTTGNLDAFLDRLLPETGRKAEKIQNIHIHDNLGIDDQHLPLGEGNIDFKRVLRRITGSGYKGGYVIEAEGSIESALKSLEYLRKQDLLSRL